MTNYALIDSNGNVDNVIELDNPADYTPASGFTLQPLAASGAGIGWTFVNGAFIAPLPSVPAPTVLDPFVQLCTMLVQQGVVTSDIMMATLTDTPQLNAVTTSIAAAQNANPSPSPAQPSPAKT